MTKPIAIAVLVALFAACQEAPPPQPEYAPRRVVELARWQVWLDEQQVGIVRRFEIQDPNGPVRFYSVEDLQHRILGEADEQGRFSRRVPFRDTGEDLGVWALPRGVGLLFEANAPADLRPVALEAAAKRSDGAR